MLEGVDNGQGYQGQTDGTATGTQSESNQRGTERSGAQGEAQRPTAGGEFALTRQTIEEAVAQDEANKSNEAEDQASVDRAVVYSRNQLCSGQVELG